MFESICVNLKIVITALKCTVEPRGKLQGGVLCRAEDSYNYSKVTTGEEHVKIAASLKKQYMQMKILSQYATVCLTYCDPTALAWYKSVLKMP